MGAKAFVFQADLLCEECGEAQKKRLDKQGKRPDLSNECSFDSDDYPKGPYAEGGGECDSPQHCGQCNTYLAAPLTQDGIEYVLEKIRDFCVAKIAGKKNCGDADVLREWAEDLRSYSLQNDEMVRVDLFLDGVRARR